MLRPTVALTIAAAAFFAAPTRAQERPPAPVRAVRAEVREIVQRERVIGGLRAESEALLAALESGAVAAVEVRAGEAVHAGDVLVRLDARRLEAERARAVAARAEAEATQVLRVAEAEDARVDLVALEKAGPDAVSERELRRARTAVAVAEARRDAAQEGLRAFDAELALLDVRLHDAALRAPFDGVVVERHVELGEWVQPGDDMITLVSSKRLEVWLEVPERFLARVRGLRPGLTVKVGGEGLELPTSDLRVVPRIDPRTRTFPVVATVTVGEDAAGVSAGMSASAWLAIGEFREVLLVPKDALVYRPGGVAVMAVRGPDDGGAGGGTVRGTAAMVPVSIAFETDREVALAPGALEAGELVVVEGNERLFPGTPVVATVDGERDR